MSKVLSMDQEQTTPEQTLTEIRRLMERSSRFISLSGMSGVMAGIYALAGAGAAYYYLRAKGSESTFDAYNPSRPDILLFLAIDAVLVLTLAVGTGIFLTTRRARSDGNSLFDSAAKKLIGNLSIPLAAGGVFCAAFVYYGNAFYVAPAMLTFYGLALIHASKYTRNDIRSLGFVELLIGFVGLFMPGLGLLLWAIGFGVLHIAYGIYMYVKYER